MVTLAIILLNVFHPGRLIGVVHVKHERKNVEQNELEDVDMMLRMIHSSRELCPERVFIRHWWVSKYLFAYN